MYVYIYIYRYLCFSHHIILIVAGLIWQLCREMDTYQQTQFSWNLAPRCSWQERAGASLWAGHHCVQQRCHVGTELEAASVTVIQHRTPLSTWNPADFPRFQPVSCQAKRCRSRPHLWWCGERICMLCGLWCSQPDGHHALWAHWILGYNATRVKDDLWNGQLSRNQWNSDQERVCPNIVDLHATYSTWQT